MNDFLYSQMKNIILIVVFVVFTPFLIFSNNFRYLGTNEGLIDGEINSITQDSTGNMWFATWTGLIKYDGYNYEVFRPELANKQSLPNKKIKKLYVDSYDNLWVVTLKDLSWFNKENNTFQTILFDRNDDTDLNILHLAEIKNHLIIHAVDGLYIYPLNQINNANYNVKKRDVVEFDQKVNYYFNYSVSFNNKLLFVSNHSSQPSEVFTVDIVINDQDTLLKAEKLTELENPVNFIEYVPNENNLYFATTKGLVSFSLSSSHSIMNTFFENQNIQKIIYTSNQELYCSLTEPKLLVLNLHTGHTSNYYADPNQLGTLTNSNIHSLYEDFSGNLWIGHMGQGISILNLHQKEFYTFRRKPSNKSPLNSNTIMCFEETENEIFIGSRTVGLNILRKKDIQLNKEPQYQKIPIPNGFNSVGSGIWDIEKESDTLFWLGTDAGLFKLKKEDQIWEIVPFGGDPAINQVVLKVFVDENKNIWFGTLNNGLYFIPAIHTNKNLNYYQYSYNPSNKTSISDNGVMEIFLDGKNRFWIGTINGLNCLTGSYENLDLSGKTKPALEFERFIAETSKENYLNNNEINCIFENYDGNIWVSTYGGGINILNPETKVFKQITTKDGLPSNDVFGILPDGTGNLWISTINGLITFNRFQKPSTFTVFNSSDGIQGNVFMINSFYKASDNMMFFGGDNGFTCFYPQKIEKNTIKPKVIFSNLMFQNEIIKVGDSLDNNVILEKNLNQTDKIVLPFSSNSFNIGVAAIHFQYPKNNKIAYFLEGYHDNWHTISASDKYIAFTNIPFGKYTLKTKAISSDNVESQNIKSLFIEIKSPWYRTWYMNILIVFFAFSSISGFVYVLINRQRLIYQKQLSEITIASNENKMMFLANIAHQLRTPLSLVIAPIEDLIKSYSTEDKNWKNHLQLIYRNSNYLLRLINQIIDFRKLNAGKLKLQLKRTDLVRVIKDVVLNFKGYESNRKVSLHLKVPSNSVFVSIDAQKIEEVLYNLISNAFKHTFDNHSITVSMHLFTNEKDFRDNTKKVRITVFNEGIELSDENKSKIFERFYKVDENVEGAGIGLSFSKSLIEIHNGTIEVETIPGKGVAFHVNLSFSDIEVNKKETHINEMEPYLIQTEKAEKNKSNPETIKDKSRVLIIEDNDELREFLVTVFSRNYICEEAANGAEGLKIIIKQLPAIVISDLIMPEMDGLELIRTLKENRETCHIPLILLTAKNTNEQIIEGFEMGADAYITKPFNVNLLLSQTARLIKNRELIREKYVTQNFMVEVESNISKDKEFLQMVSKQLEKNIAVPGFNVVSLSKELNISTTQLYRKLKLLTGHSPVEFIRIIKLQKAYSLLIQRNKTVKEICFLTGFNNQSYFIKCFKEQFGTTPASFRDNGKLNETNLNNTNSAVITNYKLKE